MQNYQKHNKIKRVALLYAPQHIQNKIGQKTWETWIGRVGNQTTTKEISWEKFWWFFEEKSIICIDIEEKTWVYEAQRQPLWSKDRIKIVVS